MDRPLSIAMFSDSALPILNGVSVSIDALIRQLREMGHSVHLFTSRYPGHSESDPNTHRCFALETPIAKDYPLALPPFYGQLREFRQESFDLVHTHTPFTVGFVGLRWAESHDLPIVTTYHTLYDKYQHYIPLMPKRYLRYKVAKHTNYYYNRADQIITPSEAAATWLQRHSVFKPITVIPTGVPNPRPFDQQETRRQLGIRPQDRVILYVGRIALEKNVGLLIEMAKNAMQRDPQLLLWLVGDGPAKEDFRKLARELGIGDRVKFVGFVDRPGVDKFYAAADIFVFSSTTETQGLVVVEAMTYGLPAIVVRGGGAGAAIEDGVNGFLVPADPGIMADQVLDVLNNEGTYERLSDGARKTSMQYTISAMAERVLTVYHRALNAESTVEEQIHVR